MANYHTAFETELNMKENSMKNKTQYRGKIAYGKKNDLWEKTACKTNPDTFFL